MIVSKGPRPIKIPDYTGKPADRAEAALEKRGFEVDTTEVNSDTVPKGRVVTQSPDSGNGQRGDVISLVVSKGPVLVEVPEVVRMGVAEAHEAARGGRLPGAGGGGEPLHRRAVRRQHRPVRRQQGTQGQHGHHQRGLSSPVPGAAVLSDVRPLVS